MILREETFKEYYPDGELFYVETRAWISESHNHLYQNYRVDSNGNRWIRKGAVIKYDRKGNVIWQIDYDQYGNPQR